MLPDLASLLNYKHEKVIRSYIRNHQANEQKANELFSDMLRYLWLSRKHSQDKKTSPTNAKLHFSLVMQQEMRDIDNMWHNFILYTYDYTQFCLQYFGEYLHHLPDVAETNSQTEEEFSTDLEKYLYYVDDHLGEATVRRWFAVHLD